MRKKVTVILLIFSCTILSLADFSAAQNKNAITYNKDGWDLLKRGDNTRAIYSFINALHKNPKYLHAMLGLGKAYYEIEAYDKSYGMYSDVLTIDSGSIEALLGSGFSLIALGRYKEALLLFNRVIEISRENITARYGIAYVYHKMDKRIWAERKIETILKLNPFHYDALLLKAELKGADRRFGDARKIVEQTVAIDNENPKAHVLLAKILFAEYLQTENEDTLADSQYALRSALSIQPLNIAANKLFGNINLHLGKVNDAIEYFQRIVPQVANSSIYYSLAYAYGNAKQLEPALENYLQAYKLSPLNTIVRAGFENFLVYNDYKVGHPARRLLNEENSKLAVKRQKNNLPAESIFYLRRTLLLNPLNKDAREQLMEYYKVLGYHRFYVDELKAMQRFFSPENYRDKLNIEVIKRRDFLYHKEGYSFKKPQRQVPRLLVLRFNANELENGYPGTGRVASQLVSFALQQYGRQTVVSPRKQAEITAGLKTNGEYLESSISAIRKMINENVLEPVDFIVYGTYWGNPKNVSLKCYILDIHKGYIINSFTVSSTGRETVPKLALRTARKIYETIPYHGTVLALKEEGVVLNLGLFDGIQPGSKLMLKKYDSSNALGERKKIILKVKESSTYVSYAELTDKDQLRSIDTNDLVYPIKRRRARRIK